MSHRRYAAAAPLPLRVERLLATAEPTADVVHDVLREHPEAERIYGEDAADWLMGWEPSADAGYAVMVTEVNRDHAIHDWFRSLGFAGRDLYRSPLYSARVVGFGIPPLESSVLHLPALRHHP